VLKIRLRREGSRNHPFFRIVVSDSRRTPTGRVLQVLGHYNPRSDEAAVKMDVEAYRSWIDKGAHASDSVKSLVKRAAAGASTGEEASA
jgi:small subunit ribosomal protein S16